MSKTVRCISPGVGDFASNAVNVELIGLKIVQMDKSEVDIDGLVSSDRIDVIHPDSRVGKLIFGLLTGLI